MPPSDIPNLPPVFMVRGLLAVIDFLTRLRLKLMPPQLALIEMGVGVWISMSLHVIAKLKVADLLKDGAMTAEEMAPQLHAHPEALYRVLRLLSGVGVFHQDRNRRFSLTPTGQKLRSDVPQSARAMLHYIGEDWQMAPWVNILHSVQTGKPSFDHVYGMPFFDYCTQHPEAAHIFDDAMTSVVQLHAGAIIGAYDFSSFQSMVDIGGGRGLLLSAILQANVGLRGILFDLPHVVASAVPQLETAGVTSRCERVGGNFFESVPQGHEVYLLSHILHDWDDESCLRILKCCKQAMTAQSKLLITDAIIPPPDDSRYQGKLSDIQMLLVLTGKERTEIEFRTLIESAGLRVNRIIPTAAPEFIIEVML